MHSVLFGTGNPDHLVQNLGAFQEPSISLLIQESEQLYFDFCETNIQDTFNAASVRYRIAIGPNSDKKTLTIRS